MARRPTVPSVRRGLRNDQRSAVTPMATRLISGDHEDKKSAMGVRLPPEAALNCANNEASVHAYTSGAARRRGERLRGTTQDPTACSAARERHKKG